MTIRSTTNNSNNGNMQMATVNVSKDFVHLQPLPNYTRWRVCSSERKAEGEIPIYTRNKGWLIDRVYDIAIRQCVLTKRGIFIIYLKPEKGFVVNMRRALSITTKTDNVRVGSKQCVHRRCRMKIHFSFGTINLVLTDEKVSLWRNILMAAAENKTTALQMQSETESIPPAPLAIEYNPTTSMSDVFTSDEPFSPAHTPKQADLLDLTDSGTVYSFLANLSPRNNNKMLKSEVTMDLQGKVELDTSIDISTCDDEFQIRPWSASASRLEDTRTLLNKMSLSMIEEVSEKTEASDGAEEKHNESSQEERFDIQMESSPKATPAAVSPKKVKVEDEEKKPEEKVTDIVSPQISVGWLRRQLENRIYYENRRADRDRSRLPVAIKTPSVERKTFIVKKAQPVPPLPTEQPPAPVVLSPPKEEYNSFLFWKPESQV